jgi:hypothetical protein
LAARRQIVVEIRKAWDQEFLPTELWTSKHFPAEIALAREKEIFGGWRAALVAAGVPGALATQLCKQGSPKYSREEVTKIAAQFPDRHLRFGLLTTQRSEWFYSALFHFDSLNAALDSAHRPSVTLPVLAESRYSEPLNFEGRWTQAKRALYRLRRDQEQLPRYDPGIIQQLLDLRIEINELATLYHSDPALLLETAGHVFEEELTLNTQAANELLNLLILKTVRSVGNQMMKYHRNLSVDTNHRRIRDEIRSRLEMTNPADIAFLDLSVRQYLTPKEKAPKPDKLPEIDSDNAAVEPPLLHYVSFKESVYDPLPWPERIEDDTEGRLFEKRVTIPGVDMRVIYSQEGSWSILIAPAWHWRSGTQTPASLSLSWDAKAMKLTRIRRPFEDVQITLQHAPKILLRFKVRRRAIHNEVTLILEDLKEFQNSGINAQGVTGDNSTEQLQWDLHRVKPGNLHTKLSLPSLDFLSPFPSLRRALSVTIDETSLAMTGQFYDPQHRQIALVDLLRKVKDSWNPVYEWLETYYGLKIQLIRDPQDQSVRLEFFADGKHPQVFAIRRRHLPIIPRSA